MADEIALNLMADEIAYNLVADEIGHFPHLHICFNQLGANDVMPRYLAAERTEQLWDQDY